jgi:hypothetical protein
MSSPQEIAAGLTERERVRLRVAVTYGYMPVDQHDSFGAEHPDLFRVSDNGQWYTITPLGREVASILENES